VVSLKLGRCTRLSEVRIAPVTGLYNLFTIPMGDVMTAAPDLDAGGAGGSGGDGADPGGGGTPLSSSAVALRKLGGGLRSGLSSSVPNVAEAAGGSAQDVAAPASVRRREGSSGSGGGLGSDGVDALASRTGVGSRTPPASTGTVSVGRRLLEMMSLGPKGAAAAVPTAASVEISGPILLHTSNKESVTPLALRARGGSASGAAGAAEISGPHQYPGDTGRSALGAERPEPPPPVPLVPLKDLIRRLQVRASRRPRTAPC
jgi:hypothetical protein